MLPLPLSCTHTYTHSLQRGKPGHHMKDHPLPPMVQWRHSDGWDGEKWERDKTTIWSHVDGSKEGEERSQRQSWGTGREWFTHLASKTGCDIFSRVALSVLSRLFACGERGPLRGSRSALLQSWQEEAAHNPPQLRWTWALNWFLGCCVQGSAIQIRESSMGNTAAPRCVLHENIAQCFSSLTFEINMLIIKLCIYYEWGGKPERFCAKIKMRRAQRRRHKWCSNNMMVLRGDSPAGKHTAEPVIGGSNEIFNTMHVNEERLTHVWVKLMQAQRYERSTQTHAENSHREIWDTPREIPPNYVCTHPYRALFNYEQIHYNIAYRCH